MTTPHRFDVRSAPPARQRAARAARAAHLAACLLLLGCGPFAPARGPIPPALTHSDELELLETAVRWPEPRVNTVMLLAAQYMANHRDEEGYRYFDERARTVPDRALFSALAGLFQVRSAWRVPLLQRVAWVEEGARKLDRATASGDPLSRYLRGLVLAELPARFHRDQQAIEDLEWMLAHADHFPPGLRHGAERALERLRGQPQRGQALLTDFSVDRGAGFRFGPPQLIEPAPGIYVARGYDFADLAWVTTSDGLVAIDAGTTEAGARAALAALRRRTTLPIRYVIITHAHWDHIGGLPALLEGRPQVIAQSGFADELARVNGSGMPFRYFFGEDAHGPYRLAPDRLIASPETVVIGDRRFGLYPAHGGETRDALLIHLPDSGVLFVGDAFMPYFGAPFVAEGSLEGFFDTVEQVTRLAPRLLIHGHTPLSENFTAAVIRPLSEALRSVYDDTAKAIREGESLSQLLSRNRIPSLLSAHGDAVVPFLLMRDNLIKRLYAQSTGYWKADGEGMEVFSRAEWAAALELSGGDLGRAIESLNQRGDYGMALELANLGLARHPDRASLRAARQVALDGLRARDQFDPFKLIIYTEMKGRDLPR
jgi:glyoxylase-like metal-dependent hydrolase (beta-lactamase superfamily II)